MAVSAGHLLPVGGYAAGWGSPAAFERVLMRRNERRMFRILVECIHLILRSIDKPL